MRSSVLRATRQQSLAGFRRYASTSTSSNAATQAQAGAAKAQEAATKYAGKAMAVLGKSGDLFARLASKTGGRTGKMLKNLEGVLLSSSLSIRWSGIAGQRKTSQLTVRTNSSRYPPHHLLLQGCIRGLQDRLPWTEDDASVCFFPAHYLGTLLTHNRSDLGTFKSSFKSLLNLAILNAFARNAIQSVRSANTKDLAFVGVLSAEVLGFFTIGEIIGRRKLVGYRGKVDAHH